MRACVRDCYLPEAPEHRFKRKEKDAPGALVPVDVLLPDVQNEMGLSGISQTRPPTAE